MEVTNVIFVKAYREFQSWSGKDGEAFTFELATPLAVGALLSFYLVAFMAIVLGELLPAVIRVPIVVIALTFVPGGLVVLLVGRNPVIQAAHLLYAYGLSLIILMSVGFVTNITLPELGISYPLTKLPLSAAITGTIGILGIAVLIRRGGDWIEIRIPPLTDPVSLWLFTLPLLAIIGVELVNRWGVTSVLVLVLLLCAVTPLLLVRRLDSDWYAFGIWTIALAILYHKSLWKYSGFGGRPHGIVAWKAGRWSPGVQEVAPYSSELLPNGLLFPMYARLADVFIMTQYEVVNPFLVSFIPVAVFVAVRNYVDADLALMSAALFAFAHPFYLQYPTAGRAASPVIFLALFGVTLTSTNLRFEVNSLFALLFLLGIVVSHYGTSYFVMAAFILAVGGLTVLRMVDNHLLPRINGFVTRELTVPQAIRPGEGYGPARFSVSLAAYFSAAAVGWYLYMRQGWKFELLPRHIRDNLLELSEGTVVTGRTASRLQRDYGAASIEYAKWIYITVSALMVLGLLVVLYHRFTDSDHHLDDQYLAIAGSLGAIFGLTILIRNWGGGRPMMVTLVFTAVFVAVGVRWLADRTSDYGGPTVFGVLLAVMLILNTGVVASAIGGSAPSNVPRHTQLANSDDPADQVTVHRETDIATHLWVIEIRGGYEVYADTFGARQFDWYRPDIAARAPGLNEGYGQRHPRVYNASTGPLNSGYLLVLGHNEDLQGWWPDRFSSSDPINVLELQTRQKVYTNGESSVYFTP